MRPSVTFYSYTSHHQETSEKALACPKLTDDRVSRGIGGRSDPRTAFPLPIDHGERRTHQAKVHTYYWTLSPAPHPHDSQEHRVRSINLNCYSSTNM